MKKFIKLLLCVLVFSASACFAVACSSTPPNDDQGLQTFTGVVFEDLTVDYDGNEHTIIVNSELPEGTNVIYTNNGPFIDAGEYKISVKISKEGYKDFVKNANLKINKINFTGIELNGVDVDYDGNEHKAQATGIPSFATVSYTNEGPFIDAGSYTTTLKVTNKNYNEFTTSATVKINKVPFEGVTFEDKSFEYDGEYHAITIAGTLPSTATVEYSCDVSDITNSARDVGTYVITATVKDKNHIDLVLQAQLKITASDEERFMAFTKDGVLYFQNAMDDNELYSYDSSTGDLERVSGDKVYDIVPYGNDGVVYVGTTALISGIKKVSSSDINQKQTLFSQAGIRYVQVDGNLIYYVINGLTNDNSGIYKIDLSSQEPTPVCLSKGKAYYLQLEGNNLYFADGTNGKKLSKISVNGVNQSRNLVVDEKINNLVSDKGALYYTVNKLIGDYIEKFVVSTSARIKLTIDAGASLIVVEDQLYYVNVDKFTTKLIGNGIYSVSTCPLVDYNLSGSLVIESGESGVCSLEYCDGNLYYYDVDGYKLMQYNLSTENAVNLLEGFVKPEEPTPISTGSKIQEYNGNIYYLDIWDGKTLHCYNPVSKQNYALTTEKVVDFNIIGDVLYVNMVSYYANNDVYYANLKTGSALTKISTYSAYEFVSDGTYVYYVEENAVGAKTAIHKCKLDGTDDTIIFDKGATNLRLVNGTLFFIEGNDLHSFVLETSTDTIVKVDNKKIHTTAFDTD